MKLAINHESINLTLESENIIDFDKVFKAWQLVTGNDDNLKIEGDSNPECNNESKDFETKRAPYRPIEYVKVDVECPFCGHVSIEKARLGDKFIKCPEPSCRRMLFLAYAADRFGIPDEKGFYYHAYSEFHSKHVIDEHKSFEKAFKPSDDPNIPDATKTISEITDWLDEHNIDHKGVTLKGKLLELVQN
ncbi:MAG: hypothetical protein ABF690_00455 [Liquorilactobacillus nagelii]|uniref:hypothetical protein n=1 Tax=Oenococcus sicerae TaxID=2203724 RepID=UPI0039E79F42